MTAQDPTDALAAIVEAAESLHEHELAQVRAFARQTSAKTQALLDSVLPHCASVKGEQP